MSFKENFYANTRKIFNENTLVGIVILAIIIFFYQMISGVINEGILSILHINTLIPVFIVVIFLEIFLNRDKMLSDISNTKESIKAIQEQILLDITHIRESIYNETHLIPFNSKREFNDYLRFRLRRARHLRIIHMSSDTSYPDPQKGGYHEIIKKFVTKEENTLERIIPNPTDNKNVINWIKDDLKKYKGLKYSVFFKKNVYLENIRLMNIMIIDNDEVCLGGGYKIASKIPTISIKNTNIASFYIDYFVALREAKELLTLNNIDYLRKEPLKTFPRYDGFYAEKIPNHEEIYKASEDLVRNASSRIWTTGFTRNMEERETNFGVVLKEKLNEKTDMEFKNVIAIYDVKKIRKEKEDYEQKFQGTKYLIKAVAAVPYHMDVLISDNKEMLLGIPAKESVDGYSYCLWIKDPNIVQIFADWYSTRIWSKGEIIIGPDGINEKGIEKIKRQLKILEEDAIQKRKE